MRFVNDLSVGKKLYGMAGVLIALMIVLGFLAISELSSASSLGSDMFQNATRPIERMTAVETSLGNVDSDLLKAVSATSGAASYVKAFQGDAAGLERAIAAYHAGGLSGAEAREYQQFETIWARYKATGVRLTQLLSTSNGQTHQQAVQLYFGTAAPMNGQLDRIVGEIVQRNDAQANADATSIDANRSSSTTLTIAILVAAIVIGGVVAFLVARYIKRGTSEMLVAAEGIAEGDVNQQVSSTSKDELGRTAAAFTKMIAYLKEQAGVATAVAEGDLTVEPRVRSERDLLGNAFHNLVIDLRKIIGDVSGSAGQIAAASQQMAATSEEAGKANGEIAGAVGEIASGAERQVQVVEAARHAAEEVTQAVAQAAEGAQQTAEVAQEARAVADDGVSAAEQATEAMRSVRDSSAAVSDAIRELSSKSEQIGAIVATITGIAEQTNLLALNAAIEAARAGEHGRGFAVVAEEVRKLAEESQRAAEEISQLVAAIQAETGHAVAVVQQGAKQTEDGAHVVEQTREAFLRIGAAVQDMSTRVDQIAAVSQQIAASAHTMQDNIGEVASVAEQSSASTEEVSASTEQTSASAQEVAASAQQLAGNAESLNRLVTQFQLAA